MIDVTVSTSKKERKQDSEDEKQEQEKVEEPLAHTRKTNTRASGIVESVAVCCSVLQCVAVCCSALPCVAVCCSVLQCVAVCRKTKTRASAIERLIDGCFFYYFIRNSLAVLEALCAQM